MRARGLRAVEMAGAALYAFAEPRGKPVICFAHVTNQMGQIDGDFEKGRSSGTADAPEIVARTAHRLRPVLSISDAGRGRTRLSNDVPDDASRASARRRNQVPSP